tara:strand:- start:316 stop:918 length:603 start_codon:yes stop_codon:yes gene_type:complete
MKNLNYSNLASVMGHWSGGWCATLTAFAAFGFVDKGEVKLVDYLAQKLVCVTGAHKDSGATVVALPNMFVNVTLIDSISYCAFIGVEIPKSLDSYALPGDELASYRGRMAKNLVHLNRIANTLLVGDDKLLAIYKFFKDTINPDTPSLIVTASLLSRVLEYYAAELYAQKLGKRIVNDSGWYEYVTYDHPGEVDRTMWTQ